METRQSVHIEQWEELCVREGYWVPYLAVCSLTETEARKYIKQKHREHNQLKSEIRIKE